MTQPDYLTGEQAASLLGVTRRTLYRWMHAGKLSADEWTPERLEARRADLFMRPRPLPCCATCGECDPSQFSPHPNRPSGYAGQCKVCNAARMRRARMRTV